MKSGTSFCSKKINIIKNICEVEDGIFLIYIFFEELFAKASLTIKKNWNRSINAWENELNSWKVKQQKNGKSTRYATNV